jgi:hypothetical protein
MFLSFQAFNGNNQFMRVKNGQGLVTQILSDGDKQDSTFDVLDANWQLGNVVQLNALSSAFQFFVLRHSNFVFLYQEFDGSDQMTMDSSFTLVGGLVNPGVGINPPVGTSPGGLVSFQSVNFPSRFIMQRASALVLEEAAIFVDQEAATWFVLPPNFPFC